MFATAGSRDTMTERSPAYAILAIDSEDRFRTYEDQRASSVGSYNDSPYNFQITKNESMMNGFFTRLALTEVCFPWAVGNINTKTKSILFNYSIGGVAQPQATLSLTYGFYKPSEIAAALQVLIRALNPALNAFQVGYGVSNIPNFAFTRGNPAVQFSFSPLPSNSAVYPFPNTSKQMYDLLGLDISRAGTDTVLKSAITGGFTFCQAFRYIDITCSQLTYNQALKDTMSQTIARDTLCRLYVGDGPFTGTSTLSPGDANFCPPGCAPFVIYRQFTNPKFIRWLPNQPIQGNLQFVVYDDAGDQFGDLGPTVANPRLFEANWSMTLLVSED
jgi:hypothetical protein